MSHNHQKKIAVINDLSGFGRCSLSVALPLISRLGVQCCPLPTAILSNHTGFDSFYFEDCTDSIGPYMAEWKKLDLQFEGILTGFLGSVRQISLVEDFLNSFTTSRTTVIIDPVMGDNGKPYATYNEEMCRQMARLVRHADILTPNLTEACILTNTPYQPSLTRKELWNIASRLSDQGPEKVVITGIHRESFLENFCFVRDQGAFSQRTRHITPSRSGTGDVFSSIVAAGAVLNVPLEKSVKTSAQFIRDCLIRSAQLDIPPTDGVCFEELLGRLSFGGVR